MSRRNDLIRRYDTDERYAHWITALLFVLLALSGLALYHPAFWWLSNLLGGGPWTRILHPFIGVAMFLSFAYLALREWGNNRMTDADRRWLANSRAIMAKRAAAPPDSGRYNGGQKLLFKLQVLLMLLMLASGVAIWQPYFAGSLSIEWVRLAAVVHAVSAFLLIALIIGHVYAAIWTKGSTRAMIRGTVSRAWARHHHPAWYRELGSK